MSESTRKPPDKTAQAKPPWDWDFLALKVTIRELPPDVADNRLKALLLGLCTVWERDRNAVEKLDDGRIALDPSKAEIARAANRSEATIKRAIRQAVEFQESGQPSPFVEVETCDYSTHRYILNTQAIFAVEIPESEPDPPPKSPRRRRRTATKIGGSDFAKGGSKCLEGGSVAPGSGGSVDPPNGEFFDPAPIYHNDINHDAPEDDACAFGERHIDPGELRSLAGRRQLLREAIAGGFVLATEADAVLFYGLLARSLRLGTKNPVGLFRQLLTGALEPDRPPWREQISGCDERQATEWLREDRREDSPVAIVHDTADLWTDDDDFPEIDFDD